MYDCSKHRQFGFYSQFFQVSIKIYHLFKYGGLLILLKGW